MVVDRHGRRHCWGWKAIGASLRSYAAAGVDIDEGNRAVEQMKAAVERTHGASVLRGVGSFGGVFSGALIKAMDDHLVQTDMVSGASILGDGTVVLILNVSAVVERLARTPEACQEISPGYASGASPPRVGVIR